MGVKYFESLPRIWAYLGSNSAFLALGRKPAGGWQIHGHTCWVQVGGLITGWKKKWYGESVQLLLCDEALVHNVPPAWRHWGVTVILVNSQSSATSYLISMQTCAHIPKSLKGACCDISSWNWIAIFIAVHTDIIMLYCLRDNSQSAKDFHRGNVSTAGVHILPIILHTT